MLLRPGFALLLGATLAGGCSDDGIGDDSSTTGPPSSTSGTTVSPTTGDPASTSGPASSTGPADPSTSTGPADPTEADTSTSTGPGPTDTGSGSTTTGDTEGTTTGGPNQACADGCVVEFMCGTEWMSEEECVQWCNANLQEADEFSPFCRDAWEGVSACLGMLTCEEFAEWENPMAFPYPCSDADAILNVECEGQ